MKKEVHDLEYYSKKAGLSQSGGRDIGICDGSMGDGWLYRKWCDGRTIMDWVQDRVLFYNEDLSKVFVVVQGIPYDGKDQFQIYIYTGMVGLKLLTRFATVIGRLSGGLWEAA